MDLFTDTFCAYYVGLTQDLEVVADCGGAHIHGFCYIRDALFAVAKQPQYPESGAVAEVTERVGYFIASFGVGHIFQQIEMSVVVIIFFVVHFPSVLSFFNIKYKTFPSNCQFDVNKRGFPLIE